MKPKPFMPELDSNLTSIAYPYSPLRPDAREFRSLEVHAGNRDDPIRCSMRLRRLDEDSARQYETVSYSWGDASVLSTLEIDGYNVTVPISATGALRQMRLPKEDRLLFLDVVCINQADIEERAQQVLIMDDIYSHSRCNLIYLGEKDSTMESVARSVGCLLDEMRKETKDFSLFSSVVADPDKRNARRAAVGFDDRGSLDFDALDQFFGRSWFRRLWVNLETLVAPTNVCLCGPYTFDLLNLLRISAWLHYKSFHVQQQIPNIINNRLWSWWIALDDDVETVEGQCGGFQTFLQILTYTSSRETSDERDRVYALHKLFRGKLPQTLLPDYRRRLIDLMCDATRQAFVDNNGHLDLTALHHVHHDAMEDLERGSWPSWVPKWTHYYNDPGMLNDSFNAGGDAFVSLDQASTAKPHNLTLQGCVFGGIDTTTVALSNETFQDPGKLLAWLEDAKHSTSGREWKPKDLQYGQLLTVVLEAGSKIDEATEASKADAGIECLVDHLRAKGLPLPGSGSDSEAFRAPKDIRAASIYDNMWLYGIERLVFGTDTGLLGLGPALTKTGDLVVVVRGSQWPLVLRPSDEGLFRFVGEAYVHGVMHGEAMRGHKEAGSSDQIFEVR